MNINRLRIYKVITKVKSVPGTGENKGIQLVSKIEIKLDLTFFRGSLETVFFRFSNFCTWYCVYNYQVKNCSNLEQ